ncbi:MULTISPECIES: dTMP kinase [Treponema]|uniref:Putative thymidylate kinase n=6 Tax=Treponema TaxID=157 RepID=KTHY_TREPA|nr:MULTISPECIES: dTMP kinase [Treponema]O83373.1 RecName: Full=Putative thymidylate kinase; AltName: Full=dTMP kinase [Treponema pallidum subsp. pallidum str. Nichols]AAC65341.1 thymidylate kinase (tmk) [Treponema pallidum subsp. pallidum str. Nichols]ACD70780.1 thymidylate kinase [Treponema pallidum subsp. pallidum SS14]ADD72479.1 thymidylate kinase [Treponema pallidum subsp. pallidum str. Chicago]AEH40297.1 dTMP kinase [Treponema paraluiscuniculi Cuniculi A]AEZ57473.1 dTMP kinase [Treponema
MNILHNFVVFEGIDGTGTSTQLRALERHFQARKDMVFTQEPTGGEIGTLIRDVLQKRVIMSSKALGLLFAADRHEHLEGAGGINDCLAEGKIVLCDRYVFSSLVYQGMAVSGSFAYELNKEFPLPEVVFYFDAPIEVCVERITARGLQTELYEYTSFQEKARKGYETIFRKCRHLYPAMKVIEIDAREEIEVVHERILHHLREYRRLK